jgi:hypothetical protein
MESRPAGELCGAMTRYTEHERRTPTDKRETTMRLEENLFRNGVGDGPRLHQDPCYSVNDSTPI